MQCDVFKQLLDRGRVVDVGIVDFIACALRAEPLDELRAEVVTFAILFVAAAADDIDEVRVDLEVAVAVFDQAREVVFLRITIRCHAHDLELAVEHIKAEEFGECAVHAAERVGVVEFFDLMDFAVFGVAKEGGGVFAFAVDAEDRGLFGEAAQVIGTTGVG